VVQPGFEGQSVPAKQGEAFAEIRVKEEVRHARGLTGCGRPLGPGGTVPDAAESVRACGHLQLNDRRDI